jgi:hypothetical protein
VSKPIRPSVPQPANEPATQPLPAGAIPRVYAGSQTVDHDVYKLTPVDLVRDVSFSEHPLLESVPHAHFFHTIDSDGRKQEYSTPAGGHFHIMKVTQVQGGAPIVECASGPMHIVRKKVKGRWVKVAEPVSEHDDHTHPVQYLRSERIQLRAVNAHAIALQTADAQKGAPVDGLSG